MPSQRVICRPILSMAMLLYLLVILVQCSFMRAATNPGDVNGLLVLKNLWSNTPSNWVKDDPCGRKWDGISCNNNSRVTAIKLSGLNLQGSLPGVMPSLPELETFDICNNPSLSGNLPENIGILTNLKSLVLVGCNFSGPIPESIGNLSKLQNLFLNSNRFNGTIPRSIGKLSNLRWLDVADNQLTGEIPVSNDTTHGLDKLTNAKHFHLGKNKLSGAVPSQLFSSSLTNLIHVVFEHNNLNGTIPDTLGDVISLQVIRMDMNSFSGTVPQSLNKLVNLTELYLSNNLLTGPLPNLTSLTSLQYMDLSNNSFDASDVPSWLTSFTNLTTLIMENTRLQGSIPAELFDLSKLQTVVLSNNNLNNTLNISTSHSEDLILVDVRNNSINVVNKSTYSGSLLLDGNDVCGNGYVCNAEKKNFKMFQPESNCSSKSCSTNKQRRPADCKCVSAYVVYIIFRAYSFSDLNKTTYFEALQTTLMNYSANVGLPVDSFSLILATVDSYGYLNLTVAIFPPRPGKESFNMTGIANIGNVFNDHQYTAPPDFFGPFYMIPQLFDFENNKTKLAIVLGVAISSVLLVLLVLVGLFAYRQRRKAQIAAKKNNPFASWDPTKGGGDIPQIKEARWFSFEDMLMITNHFSKDNEIGRGGYGKVYRATLSSRQVVAIKRAEQGSLQGALEFKTEIELLSRVHHKNIVNLVGFCFDKGEQMLIYEYVTGGTLNNMISGKLGINLDWTERLKVALGAARGIAYLHDYADPPIIHRDVKSTNILLDERLNAKVADFGLSKLLNREEKNHITDVKGTLGYLDPEYYTTQILTEKSDVYSFGVVMLELLTGKKPIEKGKHIVRAVREVLSEPSGIHTVVDPAISSEISMVGLREYLNIALRSVEEYAAGRPSMGEIVKELESIMETGGMDLESRTSSIATFGVTFEGGESTYTSSDPTFSSVSRISGSTPLLR